MTTMLNSNDGHNNRDGEGVWEECLKPGVEKKFTRSTMPITIG